MKSWHINLSKCVLLISVFSLSALCAAAGPLTAVGEQCDTIDAAELLPSYDTLQVQPDTVEAPVAEPTSFYARRTQRLKRDWARLAPNQHTLQFAGSIGMFSIGTGWHYGRRNQFETEILFGYLPNCNGSEHHYTLTVKQRYIPWHIPLSVRSQRWELEPLTCGGFANTIFGEGFWRHEPSKYTKGYYGFNTKLRYNLFIGQRIKYNIPRRHRRFNKSITAYYELSTCDLYVVSAMPNSRVTLTDILSLAFGLKMEIF